jgi:aldehyde dehydrogenase (NAD+)/succinate-semialdehyde dehydrogenase/glutarate-semialdehyde dehydrogenase
VRLHEAETAHPLFINRRESTMNRSGSAIRRTETRGSTGATGVSGDQVRRLLSGVTATGTPVDTITPATGEHLISLPQSTTANVEAAFLAARAAQRSWAAIPPAKRVKPFLRLADMFLSRQDEGLDILQWETGKARLHGFDEIADAMSSTLYYARHAPKLLKPARRGGAFPGLTRTYEYAHPKGVVATITPWNYPMTLAVDVIPALIAGNAVVHKPDNQTALSSLWPRALLIEAGLPPELWQVVLGDPAAVGSALIDNADYIGFTGSTNAGRAIGERATARLIGCSLELGGKNPMVVLADADLDKTVQAATRACFANAGQLCVSIERIYVDARIYDDFVARFARRVEELRLGFALDYGTDMGSLTSERQLSRVTNQVEGAIAAGAKVVTGGHPRPDLGPFFFEPTILVDVPPDAPLYREETFGPVVAVYPYDSEDEAISQANDTEYGLNASVFSRDTRHARNVAKAIQAGTVNINEGYASAYLSQGAPMGGMKASGIGRRHGPGGLLKYTEPQTVASQHVIGFDPGFGMNSQQHVQLFTHLLKSLKTLHIR